ncbi:hypothetical protein JTE90_027858 [Oedothorax gibbosus]|uniref:Uncharacterized protein n=1 Tax=Oedothorax gibbosus TaxID=931172 RepID=A0AAV6U7P0_9ARAC|nr:hypothetical protein JTE90_027858 [Oedothorax gibbosus]
MESSSEQPELPKSPCLIAKAVLLVFSMLIATFGLFFFAFHLHYWAVYSSLMLAVVCTLYIHQVYLATKEKLLETYSFRAIYILCFFVGKILAYSTVGFVAVGMAKHQRFSFNDGFYVAAIPSSIACCWAFLLAYESNRHMKKVTPPDDEEFHHIIELPLPTNENTKYDVHFHVTRTNPPSGWC